MFLWKLFVTKLFFASIAFALADEIAADARAFEELPPSIPTCRQDDVNINACLKAALQLMTPRLKEGFPELNIPPLDPFFIEKSSFQYSDGVVQGRVFMKNLRIYGMSDLIIDMVDFKMDENHMSMQQVSHVPRIFVEGFYKADVKLNEIKMTPKGYFNVSMTDLTISAYSEGEIYERGDGHTYLRLTKFDADPDIGDMNIYASGLLSDPTLNAIILDFVNKYWRTVYKSIIPSTRASWEPIIINSANELLSTIPLDLLLIKN